MFVLIPVSALSAFIEPVKLPLGIFLGGVLALLNLRGLSRGVENLLGTHSPAAKLVAMSMFRLLLLGGIIAVLAVTRSVNLIGLLVGFVIVYTLLLVEGLKISKEMNSE